MDILAYIDRIEDLYGNVLPRRKPPRPIEDQYQDYKQVQEYFEPRTQMYIEKEMGFDEGGRVGFFSGGTVLKLLDKIKPYTGATKIGESTKKLDRGPELAFLKAFNEYVDKNFFGNKSAALRNLGINREKFRGIEARTLGGKERRVGKISKGSIMQSDIPVPKNTIPYTETTTNVKYDKNFLKDKIKNFDKNKFYTPKDLGNIFGFDVSNKRGLGRFVSDLKRFGVSSVKKSNQQKLYKLNDAANKVTEGYYGRKLVVGDKLSASQRYDIDRKDPELHNFFSNVRGRIRKLSKEEDIYIPGAIDDVGHAMSVKITNKYPKLFKNSNINDISTLTYQDPVINRNILEMTGYEAKHDKLFKELSKLVNKKLNKKEVERLIEIKKEMNQLHNKVITDIKKTTKEGVTLYNPRKKTSTLIKSKFFTGQENRIPRIDINVPKENEIFKSENIFADMSKVNPAYRVGYIDKINPNAKKFKDLSSTEQKLYTANVLEQNQNALGNYYTKAGFPKEQVDSMKDALLYGTGSSIGLSTLAAADTGVQQADSVLPEAAAGAGAVGAYKARKPIWKGIKTAGKIAGKVLAPLAVPLEAGFVLSDLKSGSSVPEALADVVMAGGIFREREKRKFIEDKYGKGMLNAYVSAKTPDITDVMDISTKLPILSEELQKIDAEGDQFILNQRKKRAEEFERRSNMPMPEIDAFAASNGGLASLTRTVAPPRGPQYRGLDYLKYYGR